MMSQFQPSEIGMMCMLIAREEDLSEALSSVSGFRHAQRGEWRVKGNGKRRESIQKLIQIQEMWGERPALKESVESFNERGQRAGVVT